MVNRPVFELPAPPHTVPDAKLDEGPIPRGEGGATPVGGRRVSDPQVGSKRTREERDRAGSVDEREQRERAERAERGERDRGQAYDVLERPRS